MSGEIRVGVVSTAHVHARSYLERLRAHPAVVITAIAGDAPRDREAAEALGVPWRPEAEGLGAETDAIVILSENAHHRRDLEAVARPGLYVLCEKPLAPTPEDGVRMLAAAGAAGVHLFTALPVRMLGSVTALRLTVATGRLGRIVAMAGTNHGTRPPGWFLDPVLAGGGAVMDHVSHVIDLMHLTIGGEPEAVRCLGGSRLYGGAVDDAGLLLLDWEGGVTATLDPSWSRPPGYPTWGDVTLELVGERGVARLDAMNGHLDFYGGAQDAPAHRHLGYGEDMDALLLTAFLQAARSGRAPEVLADARDGFRAAAVSWAAYRSWRTGRVEKVPTPETL